MGAPCTWIALWASEGAQVVSLAHVVAERVDHALFDHCPSPLFTLTPSMSILSVLQDYVDTLQKIYEENLVAVKALQQTLTDEILPGLIDELELSDERQKEAEDWLSDTRTYSGYVSLIHVS